MKRWLAVISVALLILAPGRAVQAKPQKNPDHRTQALSTRLLNGNNWEIWQDNRGRDVTPQPSSKPGGFWPKGSGRNYIFGAGMWVG